MRHFAFGFLTIMFMAMGFAAAFWLALRVSGSALDHGPHPMMFAGMLSALAVLLVGFAVYVDRVLP